MSARFKTRTYTFLNGNPISAATILNSVQDNYVSTIALRTPLANANTVYWRDAAAGSNGGHLGPNEAVTLDLAGKFVSLSDVWVLGTAADVIELTVLG